MATLIRDVAALLASNLGEEDKEERESIWGQKVRYFGGRQQTPIKISRWTEFSIKSSNQHAGFGISRASLLRQAEQKDAQTQQKLTIHGSQQGDWKYSLYKQYYSKILRIVFGNH